MAENEEETKKKKKAVSFTIDRELLEAGKERAKDENRSFSGYVSYLIKQDLKRKT